MASKVLMEAWRRTGLEAMGAGTDDVVVRAWEIWVLLASLGLWEWRVLAQETREERRKESKVVVEVGWADQEAKEVKGDQT